MNQDCHNESVADSEAEIAIRKQVQEGTTVDTQAVIPLLLSLELISSLYIQARSN
jgi:hypothetical protein